MRGVPLGAIFQGSGLPVDRGPTMESLPAGYIIEQSAQAMQGLQPAHAALVANHVAVAQCNPLIIVLLPPGLYVGPAP